MVTLIAFHLARFRLAGSSRDGRKEKRALKKSVGGRGGGGGGGKLRSFCFLFVSVSSRAFVWLKGARGNCC